MPWLRMAKGKSVGVIRVMVDGWREGERREFTLWMVACVNCMIQTRPYGNEPRSALWVAEWEGLRLRRL